MKRCFAVFAVLTALVISGTAAQAQVKAGSYSITPFVGGLTFEGNEGIDSSLVYGLRGGYNFTKNWSLEAFYGFLNSDVATPVGERDIKVHTYGLEGLYHFFPDKRFVPFIAVGLGGASYRVDGGGGRDKFMAEYGAGLKYFLTESIALRADVRHVLPFNDRYNDLLYTVGLTFSFGGAKKESPVLAARPAEPAAPVAVEVPKDSDGDGVFDNLDKCPGTPAGVKVDKDGCPLDTDRDGVYDYLDKCPGTPAGVKVDKDGCPPPVVEKAPAPAAPMEKAIVEKGRVTLNVEFDFDKAVVKKKYHDEIGRLAAVMKKYPEITITIEGHTDNIGELEYNQKLSQRRADAIKDYLVKKFGIEASRLQTKGYGETRPIASNATAEGRQKNRRVEAAAEYVIKK